MEVLLCTTDLVAGNTNEETQVLPLILLLIRDMILAKSLSLFVFLHL